MNLPVEVPSGTYNVDLPRARALILDLFSYVLLLMTHCKINLTFQSQKPPNFKVDLEW